MEEEDLLLVFDSFGAGGVLDLEGSLHQGFDLLEEQWLLLHVPIPEHHAHALDGLLLRLFAPDVHDERKHQLHELLCLLVASELPLRLGLRMEQELQGHHAILAGIV